MEGKNLHLLLENGISLGYSFCDFYTNFCAAEGSAFELQYAFTTRKKSDFFSGEDSTPEFLQKLFE